MNNDKPKAYIMISDSLSINDVLIAHYLSKNQHKYQYITVIDKDKNTFKLINKHFINNDNIIYCSKLISNMYYKLNIRPINESDSILRSLESSRFKAIIKSDICIFFIDNSIDDDDEIYIDIQTAYNQNKQVEIFNIEYMHSLKDDIIKYITNKNIGDK